MAENEITTSPPSNRIGDPADVSLDTTPPQEQETDTTADTSTSSITDQDVSEEHRDADPHLELLRAMFPDYDDSLLQSVLQSVGGDHNRAIDALLGMSDPQYTSEVIPDDRNESVSQVDLDEQLARRLMLEEHQAAQQQQQQQQQRSVPYEPYQGSARHGHRSGQPQPQSRTGPGDERDTMADIQDHVSRIADTGKKTFESIFSKVKAKIQEYDKPSRAPEPPTEPPAQQQPSWSGVAAAPSPRWSYNNTNREQPSYYDPNPSISSPPPPSAASKPIPAPIPVRGYDIEPEQGSGIAEPRKLEVEPAPDVPSPSRPSTAIDGGKLGLLPKRPISLLKPQESENAEEPTRQDSSESNDELEYAENPFEDSRN